jgi:hypothetical protein
VKTWRARRRKALSRRAPPRAPAQSRKPRGAHRGRARAPGPPPAGAEGLSERFGADYNFPAIPRLDLRLEGCAGSERSHDIDMQQFRFALPIGDRFDLGLDVVHESMSGATPWYVIPGDDGTPVQVMTGATIDERRTDALLQGRLHLERGRLHRLSGGNGQVAGKESPGEGGPG